MSASLSPPDSSSSCSSPVSSSQPASNPLPTWHSRLSQSGAVFDLAGAQLDASLPPDALRARLVKTMGPKEFNKACAQIKPCFAAVVDNGSDWKPGADVIMVQFGRLWRALGLDMMVLGSNAAGQSQRNDVERRFAPLSKAMANLILPATLPDETLPPSEQSLSADEREEKEGKILVNAGVSLASLWNQVMLHDSYHYSCYQHETSPETSFLDDETQLRDFFNCSERTMQDNDEYKALRAEISHLLHHVDHRLNAVCFMRCELIDSNRRPCAICRALPPVRATGVQEFTLAHGGALPVPHPSAERPGHFATLDEMRKSPASFVSKPDTFAPSLGGQSDAFRCDICKYFVASTGTQLDRHGRKFHRSVRSKKASICMFLTSKAGSQRPHRCGLMFQSRAALLEHQHAEQHKQRKRNNAQYVPLVQRELARAAAGSAKRRRLASPAALASRAAVDASHGRDAAGMSVSNSGSDDIDSDDESALAQQETLDGGSDDQADNDGENDDEMAASADDAGASDGDEVLAANDGADENADDDRSAERNLAASVSAVAAGTDDAEPPAFLKAALTDKQPVQYWKTNASLVQNVQVLEILCNTQQVRFQYIGDHQYFGDQQFADWSEFRPADEASGRHKRARKPKNLDF